MVAKAGGAVSESTRPATAGERILPEVDDTEALGRELAAQLQAGDLVILDGPLGAGKTAMTRGIAAGLGVIGRVSSPTFIIAREHRAALPGRPGLIHVDAYRLGGLDELDALDLDTDLADSVIVVEWGEGVAERLVERHLLVRLRREPESEVRSAAWEWVEH
ncbi:tRNA (adenosine(37)-N6)-threonylcarbamoyltransferase complex ATPase subunit type 1 TsaE [Gordonia sp. Z-3]|uniref:tRNA threonylcarbamoyladenosine biosynthesis protein TsaE n=1 Tax=Gordonia aquimaris TaxID=2984863 RepID=A0A9X3D0D2_9ACTN|nr:MULTISPECIES: tRNA (adenosine(37)-N6)-threonylcarbamoyltransferase complex ATPase subunit type 1 TsaE [Gordonia]MCX2962523.1 tRNA (adenosine(37)-N6)-threonylcarbamoyltransferase complex ATPase subunit type 1 TsaE [Gordonia aquimaris]MED5801435.1 tRNA (adenosine(37)-N6)-threonylcarbamoyltransferase complex ATPase subunit type 1 TsaE [Gordonia sp. Z-3]